jgi:hypothetical protein
MLVSAAARARPKVSPGPTPAPGYLPLPSRVEAQHVAVGQRILGFDSTATSHIRLAH